MSVSAKKLLALAAAAISALSACVTPARDLPPLTTVAHVDLQRYAGAWFEIARFPHRFQKGCVASRAVYTLRDDGLVGVYNECRKGSYDGPVKSVQGRARVVDRETNAKLEVSFFGPFWGDYWIIDLDPEYRWAVVGHPSRKYLWILARAQELPPVVLEGIRERLERQGYDLSKLVGG